MELKCEPKQGLAVGLAYANLTLGVLGVFGNGLVLLLFRLDRKCLDIAHYFIISMALSDFLECLVGAILTTSFSIFMSQNHSYCVPGHGIKAFLYLSTLFSVVLTSIDRYWGIVHAIHYRQNASRLFATVQIVVMWTIAAAIGAMVVLFHQERTPLETCQPCFMFKLVHRCVVVLIFFGIIPVSLFITIISYLRIYWKIAEMVRFREEVANKSMAMAMMAIVKGSTATREIMNRCKRRRLKELRTTLLMCITVFFFIVCWLPGIVFVTVLVMGFEIDNDVKTATYMLYTFNSALNPFLYAFHISTVRTRLKQLWEMMICKAQREKIRTARINSIVDGCYVSRQPVVSNIGFADFELNFEMNI